VPAPVGSSESVRWAARVVTLALLVSSFAITPAKAATPREALHDLINAARASRGLSPLRLNDRLSKLAHAHSVDMAAGSKVLYHSCLTCRLQSWDWRMAGENVGTAGTVARVHRLFMLSPSHRANVLRPGFRTVGLGIVDVGGRLWVTQVFLG
jgi:uncharacterized protein YkwD